MIRIRFSTIYTYFYENLNSKKLKFKINNRLNHTMLVTLRIYVTMLQLDICCNIVARKKKGTINFLSSSYDHVRVATISSNCSTSWIVGAR